MARYINLLADYNIQLVHKPGMTNRADHLSQWPDYDTGEGDNKEITALPNHLFINTINMAIMERKLHIEQDKHHETLQQWKTKYRICYTADGWFYENRLVIMEDNDLRRGVINVIHNSTTAGHPGITKTYALTTRHFWWPGMKNFITKYVQGYATCQSKKIMSMKSKPPIFPIQQNKTQNHSKSLH